MKSVVGGTSLLLVALACGGGPVPIGSPTPAAAPAPTPSAAPAPGPVVAFNHHPATPADLAELAPYEKAWGVRVPPGDYWYDDRSGAAGVWGGPTRGFLAPGLHLGHGQVPADASGGGSGRTTGVFVNGRELHPQDVKGLGQWLGTPPIPGRWWVDGSGNFGLEGQSAPAGNLLAIAAQKRGGGGTSYYSSDPASGASTFVGSGCASVSGRLSPSDSDSSYSYFVGCE